MDARSHQQLFDDVLTLNGIPLGWTIDYGLEAWNVPAGVFAHQGTFISALATLACRRGLSDSAPQCDVVSGSPPVPIGTVALG